ncbi:thiamine-phosphate diphosphorylase [Desulfitispora alkaliphila]|uniref:thiamine phosphate synthase n=1 Tax=Desulfitispora alkaliphila TaxID=622674 RepID=UPI003D1C1247
MMTMNKYGLYVVTDENLTLGRSIIDVVGEALEGGADVVQLRSKSGSTRDMIDLGGRLLELVKKYNSTFIVNDRVDVALAIDAHGVHVGQDDMPPDMVRKLLGSNKILGVSVDTVEDAKGAVAQGADYLGAGAVFLTNTKTEAPEIGTKGLKEIVNSVDVPVVAIGGIKLDNLGEVMSTGVDGVAVVSGIMSAKSVKSTAEQYKKKIIGQAER